VTRAARIDAWLPQTQCQRCGYPRCRAYAEAIARGEAGIDRCPPGGEVTRRGLAALLRIPMPPPDAERGDYHGRTVVRVDEPRCIGCTLCIQVCPVDAIVGTSGFTHTVLAQECTGCDLCIPACPVDCITSEAVTLPAPDSDPESSWRWPEHPPAWVEQARHRTAARLSRLARERSQRARRGSRPLSRLRDRSAVRAELAAVLERARGSGSR